MDYHQKWVEAEAELTASRAHRIALEVELAELREAHRKTLKEISIALLKPTDVNHARNIIRAALARTEED
jgi:hypothetical protein